MKGQLIKQHRKYRDLTLEELASGICSASYLSKIEHNTINASDEIYRLLGEKLNIKLDNLNEEFDDNIYEQLFHWHEAIKFKDTELMDKLYRTCKSSLAKNHNIELANLYKVILSRYKLAAKSKPLSKKTLKELHDVFSQSSQEYRFLYYKTIGLHYFLLADYKNAIKHFHSADEVLEQLPLSDHELYYHLALSYNRLRMYVESNYYAEIALDSYQNSLNYQRVTDCHILLAINFNCLEVYHVAERLFLKLLRVSKNQLNLTEQGKVYHNLGCVNYNQGKYEQALDYLQEALDFKKKQGISTVSTLFLLAETHYYGNNSEESAWEYLSLGEAEALQSNDLKYIHKLFVLKHIILHTTHKPSFIEKLEKKIIPDFRELNEYEDYKEHLELLGEIYYEKRMYKKCSMLFIEANRYKTAQKKDLY
ncbi:helix-turn-helix transcriptional regulator [Halobacillus sp. Marseille-Q1614]|uniref:helix-turn-helix transcriptional regulator n=1 Tax=Halobacillus sp. Marseille-Q1614 TaxID=2709134 RepID=UPI00156F092D|nr:helix-turn-helix transcriptional regulator [Halobacillus sp. Marseille-Q1614]